MANGKQKSTGSIADPSQNLQNFDLHELEPFTFEKAYSSNASKDFHLFYVGRDDVHSIIKNILSRVRISLYLNMYSYDDSELNDIILSKVTDKNIVVLITLDKSQTGSKTEKALLNSDAAKNPAEYKSHFVIGDSSTGQISHTKGFVADGRVAAEGSTNWSASGEGIFVTTGQPGGLHYKAQNNTQSIITDTDTINRFTAELIREHMAAQHRALEDPTMRSSLKTPLKKSPARKPGT